MEWPPHRQSRGGGEQIQRVPKGRTSRRDENRVEEIKRGGDEKRKRPEHVRWGRGGNGSLICEC